MCGEHCTAPIATGLRAQLGDLLILLELLKDLSFFSLPLLASI